MDPISMFLIGSSILKFGSSLFAGTAKKQQGDRDQHIANYNARNMENDAIKIRKVGVEKENDLRRGVEEMASRQRASFGASGVIVDTGSAEAIQRDTYTLGEIDARRVRETFIDEADALDDRAMLNRMQGKASAREGRSALLTSVLTGGAQFAQSAYTTGKSEGWWK